MEEKGRSGRTTNESAKRGGAIHCSNSAHFLDALHYILFLFCEKKRIMCRKLTAFFKLFCTIDSLRSCSCRVLTRGIPRALHGVVVALFLLPRGAANPLKKCPLSFMLQLERHTSRRTFFFSCFFVGRQFLSTTREVVVAALLSLVN